MSVSDMVTQVREAISRTMSVHAVFGEPIERDGVTIIPVAQVGGFGGGRGGGDKDENSGGGGGFGAGSRPLGVFVVKGEDVRWQPAVNVNRAILGGQVVAVALLLVLRSVLRRR